jgi:hypothetical protein
MKFYFILGLYLLVVCSVTPVAVFADTVGGNGYVLEQSMSSPSYALEGNGYTATQTLVPVVAGQLEGNGYSSAAVTPTSPVPPAPVPGSTQNPVAPSSGSSSSGQLAFAYSDVPGLNDMVREEVLSGDTANSELSSQLDELIEPFIGTPSRGLSELYQELGGAIRTGSEGVKGIDRVPVVVEAVSKVFDSKSTFSVLTMAVVVLLFMSLGVSVFGYKEIHKIISTVVCIGSLFGYYTTSSIYLLPAIVGFIVLIIFMIQQKEHEISPIKLD